jgi:DNA replication protein DnaC
VKSTFIWLTEFKVERQVQNLNEAVEMVGFGQRQDKIGRWLQAPDPSINYNKALKLRHEGSGGWFLKSSNFTEWKEQKSSFLWLHGIPGCGKTVLSSSIIKNLESSTSHQPLLYFFFDFSDASKQKFESMVRSVITQLYYKHPETRQELDSLFSSCKDGQDQPSNESLCNVLIRMIEQVKEIWLVLDALDECSTRKGSSSTEGLVLWIEEVLRSERLNIHIIVTSRPEQDIQFDIMKFANTDNIIRIQSSLISDDIRAYIRTRVREDSGFERWRSRPEILDEIETRLMEKAGGM